MILVISPAKNLDFSETQTQASSTQCVFLNDSKKLILKLKKLKEHQIGALMDISPALASLNLQRYKTWQLPFTQENAKPAVYAFNGEVYNGLNADMWQKEDQEFAQDHLRILSGLYGVLKPFDLIQPYRLEMGTKLEYSPVIKDLYSFWGDKITKEINVAIAQDTNGAKGVLINLASHEYFKAVNLKKVKAKIITPVFKEKSGDTHKVVMVYAKKARGMMSSFVIQHKLDNPEHIKSFDKDGYAYTPNLSTETEWVFTR